MSPFVISSDEDGVVVPLAPVEKKIEVGDVVTYPSSPSLYSYGEVRAMTPSSFVLIVQVCQEEELREVSRDGVVLQFKKGVIDCEQVGESQTVEREDARDGNIQRVPKAICEDEGRAEFV